MSNKYWISLTGVVLLVLGILILRPVPIPNEMDCEVVSGTVIQIEEQGVKDIVFTIARRRHFMLTGAWKEGLSWISCDRNL